MQNRFSDDNNDGCDNENDIANDIMTIYGHCSDHPT